MIRACIFDLDGTLLYTLESIAHAGNEALLHFGHPAQPTADYRFYCGNGADELVRRIMKKVGDSDPLHFEEACRINREMLAGEPLFRVQPYQGMKEALTVLKQKGLKLGVCSNKPDAAVRKAILGSFGENLFDAVQGQAEGMHLKPSPDEPFSVAEKLEVKPEECLYFGDTGTDMQTGNAAGMKTVGVLWGYRTEEELKENGAARLISSPAEILPLAEEMS